MRRRSHDAADLPGQDSFLDIVANIVGILIILVTVVGVRASFAPPLDNSREDDGGAHSQLAESKTDGSEGPIEEVDNAKTEAEQIAKDLASARDHVATLQGDVAKIVQQLARAEREADRRDSERVKLQMLITALNEALDERRDALDEVQREELALREQLAAVQSRLEDLARDQFTLESTATDVETVVSLPTPLAKTVRGDEIHIRLAHGRVALVPIDALVALFEQDAQNKLWKLEHHNEWVGTVGPIGGFRLRYRLARQSFTIASGGGVRRGTMVQLDKWELLPVVDDLGVPVEQALMPGAELREALCGRPPDATVVTIWTYSQSFSHFRALKKSLFDLGYSAAARPLPSGIRIGGSPRGAKSSVQ